METLYHSTQRDSRYINKPNNNFLCNFCSLKVQDSPLFGNDTDTSESPPSSQKMKRKGAAIPGTKQNKKEMKQVCGHCFSGIYSEFQNLCFHRFFKPRSRIGKRSTSRSSLAEVWRERMSVHQLWVSCLLPWRQDWEEGCEVVL